MNETKRQSAALATPARLRLALVVLLWGVVAVSPLAAQPSPAARLTTVRQVHAMSPEDAAKHLPILLRGVVTTISPYPNAFFMQDATAGISLEGEQLYGVFPGARIEVTGETAPGRFAPLVKIHQVRVLGKGPLPPAPSFSYPELVGGLEDSNWIELQGVVRSVKPRNVWGYDVLIVNLEVDGHLVTVQMMDYRAADPASLVDSVITVRGVCTTSFNDKRQFTGIGMITPSMAFVDTRQAAPPDPFRLAATPVRSLLQFKPGVRYGHRVLVQGTVTYQDPGHTLYVQDGSDGVLVESDQDTPLPLGTTVAVVGFPDSGVYSPILRQAIFRPLPTSVPVRPVSIQGDDFLHKGKFITAPFDAQLVTLKGQLVEVTHRLNDDTWLLRDGDNHFEAILKHREGATTVQAIEDGSLVSATGIFSVEVDEERDPTTFRVLLRGPDDLVVVQRAGWWSPRHVFPALVLALFLTLAVALWGATLRRTVRQQTQMLRQSEERFRDQAHHDALTGLVSRSFLHEQLHEAIRQARFSGQKLGVMMVDLDFFKQVNDTLGHHAGDELLCLVAKRLRATVRKSDVVARMGGDEFVVLLTDLKDANEAAEIGAQVVAGISSPAEIAGQQIPISASVGVCLYPEGGLNGDALLQNVDAAMYEAKASGRNSCAVYPGNRRVRDHHARAIPQLASTRA